MLEMIFYRIVKHFNTQSQEFNYDVIKLRYEDSTAKMIDIGDRGGKTVKKAIYEYNKRTIAANILESGEGGSPEYYLNHEKIIEVEANDFNDIKTLYPEHFL